MDDSEADELCLPDAPTVPYCIRSTEKHIMLFLEYEADDGNWIRVRGFESTCQARHLTSDLCNVF